jgi:pimeloyl-ACP methyl ester carboxylesterase
MPVEECNVEAGSLRWFYRQATPTNPTENLPVVLLHGIPSQSYSWRGVLPALAEYGFLGIAPDWIGSGFSAKPDRRDFSYSPAAFITALESFLQSLQVSWCSLVVQGFLGSVGLQYALRYPQQIDRLVILNTPLMTGAQLPWRIRQLGLPLVGDMLTQDPLLVDRTLEGGSPYQVADKDLDVYRRPFLKSSDAGRSLLATVQNLQLPQAMAEIEAGYATWQGPVQILWGIKDPWLSVDLARQFVKMAPNARLSVLEEVGHYPQEDWHEKVNDVLIPFLRRQDA